MIKKGKHLAILLFFLASFLLTGCSEKSMANQSKQIKQVVESIECPECNIIILSLDSVRSDHLGIYGYNRNTSPNIDKYFKDEIMVIDFISQAPVTAPSHMSLFTSLYPKVHKIRMPFGEPKTMNQSLSTSIITLPEILKENGYINNGYVGGLVLKGSFGFERGFDKYVLGDQMWHLRLKYMNTTFEKSEALKFIEQNKDQKFFLFLHTFSPHSPYISPDYEIFKTQNHTNLPQNYEEFKNEFGLNFLKRLESINTRVEYPPKNTTNFKGKSPITPFHLIQNENDIQSMIDMYDASIHYTDRKTQLIFDKLKDLNIDNKTIVILIGDHGEEFNEHKGFGHGKTYIEHLQVPLLIKHPHLKNLTISSGEIIDITPTILDFLNINNTYNFQGESLINENPNIYSYSYNQHKHTLRTKQFTLRYNESNYYFYDRLLDPYEKNNIIDDNFDKLAIENMKNKMDEYINNNQEMGDSLNQIS